MLFQYINKALIQESDAVLAHSTSLVQRAFSFVYIESLHQKLARWHDAWGQRRRTSGAVERIFASEGFGAALDILIALERFDQLYSVSQVAFDSVCCGVCSSRHCVLL